MLQLFEAFFEGTIETDRQELIEPAVTVIMGQMADVLRTGDLETLAAGDTFALAGTVANMTDPGAVVWAGRWHIRRPVADGLVHRGG